MQHANVNISNGITRGSSASVRVSNRRGIVVNAKQRYRIGVDLDEVLGRFIFTLNRHVYDQLGRHFTESDYHEYLYAKVWGVSDEKSIELVHSFYKSRYFREGIPVIPGALETLQRLSKTSELYVITSRQHAVEKETRAWLDANFSGIFRDVVFCNHWALDTSRGSRSKRDVCLDLGCKILIDDSPGHAIECAEAGIEVLLYNWDNRYPWSKVEGQDRITPVHNWNDVEFFCANHYNNNALFAPR